MLRGCRRLSVGRIDGLCSVSYNHSDTAESCGRQLTPRGALSLPLASGFRRCTVRLCVCVCAPCLHSVFGAAPLSPLNIPVRQSHTHHRHPSWYPCPQSSPASTCSITTVFWLPDFLVKSSISPFSISPSHNFRRQGCRIIWLVSPLLHCMTSQGSIPLDFQRAAKHSFDTSICNLGKQQRYFWIQLDISRVWRHGEVFYAEK
jgi:hypothetical protein